MKSMFGCMPLQNGRSDVLVNQIMRTLHMTRSEATTMALRMFIEELILAAMATPSPEESFISAC